MTETIVMTIVIELLAILPTLAGLRRIRNS